MSNPAITQPYSSGPPDVSTATGTLAVNHGGTGATTAALARTDLGLGNVDNTSDASKPVSTAQQTAIDLKLSKASNLSDLSNIPTSRTNLGLGTMATQANNNVNITGGSIGGLSVIQSGQFSFVGSNCYLSTDGFSILVGGDGGLNVGADLTTGGNAFIGGDLFAQSLTIGFIETENMSVDTLLAATNLSVFFDVGCDTVTAGSTIKTGNFTVATLPSAATSGVGARAFVTDALAPTFGATVVGGGAVKIPVYSDGSVWKVG